MGTLPGLRRLRTVPRVHFLDISDAKKTEEAAMAGAYEATTAGNVPLDAATANKGTTSERP